MHILNALRVSLGTLGLVAFAGAMTACVYDDDHHRDDGYDSMTVSPAPSSSSSTTATGGTATTSAMLVQVDTDQTMNATGGDGVGIFVEYGKGGHWHIWWTCDTNQTQENCNFSIGITTETGAITNVDASQLGNDVYTSPSTSEVDLSSTVTTDVKGIRFDTPAGAIIDVQAALGSVQDGSFLFFVEDGKVNGGFTGKLTNPLRFEGSSP